MWIFKKYIEPSNNSIDEAILGDFKAVFVSEIEFLWSDSFEIQIKNWAIVTVYVIRVNREYKRFLNGPVFDARHLHVINIVPKIKFFFS